MVDGNNAVVPSQIVSIPDSTSGDYLLTFLVDVPAAGFNTYYIRTTYVEAGGLTGATWSDRTMALRRSQLRPRRGGPLPGLLRGATAVRPS